MDILKVLADGGLEAESSGSGFAMAVCPFHEDSAPSLSVATKDLRIRGRYVEAGSYRCFACDAHGSLAELVAYLLDIEVVEAYKITHSRRTVDGLMRDVEESLAPEKSVRYYSYESFGKVFPAVEGTRGEAYIQKRKITTETMHRFDVRWGTVGVWQDRVVLPIFTTGGRLLSYTGRTVWKGVEPKTRKARSPKGTLYGAYELGQTKVPALVLVEGEFDAMYLQQEGVPAVAQMGTSPLTCQQMGLIRRMTDKVVLSYDGDSAGSKAANRTTEDLSGFMVVEVLQLPDLTDPNDLSKIEVQKMYKRWIA